MKLIIYSAVLNPIVKKGKWMYVIGSGKFNKIKLLDLQY